MHLKAGSAQTGLALIEKLVEHNPLDEEASCRLMRAMGILGDRSGIVREFERISRALEADLQTRPLPETRRACDLALAMTTKDIAKHRKSR